MTPTETLIRAYYTAFNASDLPAFLDLLTDDVVHDINQGGRECGKPAFSAFWSRMQQSYREQVVDLVVCCNPLGTHAAAEFVVMGKYLVQDHGLPPAKGQQYRLPAGAFFEVRNGQVARISNYYNLHDWLAQVSI